jgi:diketogulonate reductase-like aldo/keto reductase
MSMLAYDVPVTRLPSGETVPVLGQGTWGFAEDPGRREKEIASLQLGLDLGLTLVDTAEMYADGACEELVGQAIAGRRDEVFLVSKVLPWHATRRGTIEACERSLRRLGTDRIDLYLLHSRGRPRLRETLEAFALLTDVGKIRHWGVSNFGIPDMRELADLPGGSGVSTDQVLYNLTRRGIEYDLLPWCRRRDLPVMAYAPIEQGRLLAHPGLAKVAARHGASTAQVALSWLLRQDGVIAIPRAATADHVCDNHSSIEVRLTDQDLTDLDLEFPRPSGPRPLETL